MAGQINRTRWLVLSALIVLAGSLAHDALAAGTAPQANAPAAAAPSPAPAPAASPAPANAPPAASAAPAARAKTADADAPAGDDDPTLMLSAIDAMDRVGESKEKSVRAKAALLDLEGIAKLPDHPDDGTVVQIVHRNELPSQFILVGVAYALDDKPLFTKVDDSGDLNLIGEQLIARAHCEPGQHHLAVQYDLRGNGFGFLSYLEDIKLTLRNSYTFTVDPSKSTTVSATVYSKGLLTKSFKDRPAVSFAEKVEKNHVAAKQEEASAKNEQ